MPHSCSRNESLAFSKSKCIAMVLQTWVRRWHGSTRATRWPTRPARPRPNPAGLRSRRLAIATLHHVLSQVQVLMENKSISNLPKNLINYKPHPIETVLERATTSKLKTIDLSTATNIAPPKRLRRPPRNNAAVAFAQFQN